MSRAFSFLALWSIMTGTACGSREPPRTANDSVPGPAQPPDSLVLRAPGADVWFTAARQAADSAGQKCVERVMEIRRDGKRIPVPLLYTGQAPTLVNDSTLRADIWLHCRPGNHYVVDLRTGFPTRVLK